MNMARRNVELGILITRVLTGLIFLLHGLSKFQGGIGGAMGFFQGMGLPGWLAPVVAVLEIAGGIALILGLFTRIAGVVTACIIVGTLVTAHKGDPFLMGTEFNYLLLITSLQMAISGSALLSLDGMFWGRERSQNRRLAEN
ncbi:DoxX family protein [Paenibacillus wulumuqiensis]|uniref:DoxX family protein n=1 Tax=Paenibacillus wulumuqiensis TaxID=1567107 RepID=UPI00069797F5|nr:DoxX family protein [Paenibacillus wulumuqiensis]